MPIRILIAEDQRIVREGLIALLEDESEIEIVGEAADGRQAVEMFAALQPDVVLMDLQMPVLDGPEATRQIRAQTPDAHILVLTTYATDEFIFKALRAGAQGYLLKDTSADELLAGIRAVYQGQTQLAPCRRRQRPWLRTIGGASSLRLRFRLRSTQSTRARPARRRLGRDNQRARQRHAGRSNDPKRDT